MRSMTCYGAGRAERDGVALEVELRSVNHRFLDLQLRIPRDYMALEARIGAAIKARFSRGRVEVFVRREDGGEGAVNVNHAVAGRFVEALRALKDDLGLSGNIDLSIILAQPGVVVAAEPQRDADADWPVVEEALTQALEAALAMSLTEGDALARDMAERLDQVAALHHGIEEKSAGQVDVYRERLRERVGELLARASAGELDEGRMLQEVAHLADRTDITEEITRMGSHLVQCRELFDAEEPVGRKLDFLLQELFRETNTIASKTPLPEIKAAAVDIKVELERIREQIQNIE